MTARVLGVLQVAALLVSASYGIGFLFGSGEMALTHGMAGGLYGVATALGMLALATFAGRLWKLGVPVWELFGRAFGVPIQRAVALLSLIWMSGVLAAQIAGGVAIAEVIGLPKGLSQALVLALILGASRLDLRIASRVFAACLLASAVVLVYALADAGGMALYAQSATLFARDLGEFSTGRLVSIVLAVGLLVCLGSDYHQFVLAARRPATAAAGCALAAVVLIAVAFLPPTLVLALRSTGGLDGLTDAKQVVPFALGHAADGLWPVAQPLLLAALSTAALGSGAAIVRAMASAMAAAWPGTRDANHWVWSVAALAAGGLLAARGQGIVETMVSVNVVYLASVGWLFVLLLRGATLSVRQAASVMASGLAASGAVYLAGWLGWIDGDADTVSLAGGLAVSVVVGLACAAGGLGSIRVGGLRR
jgi:SSS family solute:Na+ symporter